MPIKAPNNSQAAHAARKIRWWYGRKGTVAYCLFRSRSMRFNSRSRDPRHRWRHNVCWRAVGAGAHPLLKATKFKKTPRALRRNEFAIRSILSVLA